MEVTRISLSALTVLLITAFTCMAQATTIEQRVALGTPAVALDAAGTAALESSLLTTGLNGAPDTPVTNIRMVVRNVSPTFFAYVSGVVSFYDSNGVRCGDGLFKADVLAPSESVETDTPGIRIRCSPSTWRIVATNLVLRTPASVMTKPDGLIGERLLISVDGEEHPIQLDKPMVITVGDAKRTIVVRQVP
jgi:hypothetical protein